MQDPIECAICLTGITGLVHDPRQTRDCKHMGIALAMMMRTAIKSSLSRAFSPRASRFDTNCTLISCLSS